MAKEKELAGKLIGILPQLFVLDDNFLSEKNSQEGPLNLNKVIAS